MPLSEHEQRVLEQMERHLSTDDPRLANTLTQRGRRPAVKYMVAVLGSAVGLLLLILGAHESMAWLGAVGFIVMFAAVAFAFARPRLRVRASTSTVRAGSSKPRRPSFMDRFEQRWDRRREEH